MGCTGKAIVCNAGMVNQLLWLWMELGESESVRHARTSCSSVLCAAGWSIPPSTVLHMDMWLRMHITVAMQCIEGLGIVH